MMHEQSAHYIHYPSQASLPSENVKINGSRPKSTKPQATINLLHVENENIDPNYRCISVEKVHPFLKDATYTFRDKNGEILFRGKGKNIFCFLGSCDYNVEVISNECDNAYITSSGGLMCRNRKMVISSENLNNTPSDNIKARMEFITGVRTNGPNAINIDFMKVKNANGDEIFNVSRTGLATGRGFGALTCDLEISQRNEKIGAIKMKMSQFGSASNIKFEYSLPLDTPTLLIIICCILGADDLHRESRMLIFRVFFVIFGLLACFVILPQILILATLLN